MNKFHIFIEGGIIQPIYIWLATRHQNIGNQEHAVVRLLGSRYNTSSLNSTQSILLVHFNHRSNVHLFFDWDTA